MKTVRQKVLRGGCMHRENKYTFIQPSTWVDINVAAKYLSLSVGALRNLTSQGKVPYYKFGRRNRYRLDELNKILLKNPKGERNGNN